MVWGLYHGLFLVLERWGLRNQLAKLPRLLRHAYVMMACLVGWVFFRADTLSQALDFLGAMFFLQPSAETVPFGPAFYLDRELLLTWLVSTVAATPVAAWLSSRLADRRRFVGLAELATSGAVALLFFFSVSYLAAGTQNPFIYFRF